MNAAKTKKTRGRPSEFNHEEALEKALMVFWTRGFEGASMSELTEAMGINRPSLYATFGNKEELFIKALSKYLSGPVAYVAEAMQEATAKQVAKKFLTRSAEFLTNESTPRGCMIAIGGLFSGDGCERVKQELISYRQAYERALRERFELAKSQNDLKPDINPQTLAKYVATIHQGMSVQAASGANKEQLLSIVELSLSNWP